MIAVPLELAEGIWRILPDALVRAVPALERLRDHVVQRRLDIAKGEYDAGSREGAIQHMRRALEADPANVEVLNSLGTVYFEANRAEEAIKAFEKVLELDFDNAVALQGLGYSLDTQGRTEEAVYCYLRYLPLKPDNEGVRANLIAALAKSGRTNEAIAAGERAKGMFPDDPMFAYLLAQSYYDAGRLDEAEHNIVAACEREPSNADMHRFAGAVFSGRGDLDKSVEALRRAVELEPDNGQLQLELSHVLEAKGSLEEYCQAADKARELFEVSGDREGLMRAWWEVGWAYYNLGRWSDSAEASAKAIELNPTAPAPRFNLGLALLRKGDVAGAKAAYRAAAALNDAASLKWDGIDDLTEALEESPQLAGGAEILRELQAEAERIAKEAPPREMAKE